MALKRKKMSKLEGEQLYMLEILIDRLNLCPEKVVNDKKCNLMIRINFIDLMPVDIIVEESTEINGRTRNKENRSPDVNCEGKTCLLIQPPSNLIRSVKSIPLSVEVYKVSREGDHNPQDDTCQVLLCAATAFLPGHFCDRVAAAKDKIDGLSESYMLTEIYTLTDEYGNPCGSISMSLRLSCFGSSIINHLTLHEKSFVLRGFPFGGKLPCTKLSNNDINGVTEKYDDKTLLLREILDPSYSKLYNQNNNTKIKSVLTRPESSPCISMGQPGFEKLTSAEKLNDRKYRSLIYEIYPDESTCSCPPINQSMHPMMCRSGCVRSCCMALRNPDAIKHFPSFATLAHYSDDSDLKPDAVSNLTDRDITRMRGGENIENNYLNNEELWDEEHTWHENNMKNRMTGGSDYASAYALSNATNVIYEKSKKTGVSSRPRNTDRIEDCICPGKAPSRRPGAFRCTKKPCVGADCMIRAFKEAQEFVDSLGKVPGLVGLGLMDPSESPYFGRDVQKDCAVPEAPSEKKQKYPVTPIQCPAPCNTQIGTPIVSTLFIPQATSSPIQTAVPGRTGVVREAIPVLPVATLVPVAVKPKKKEDKKEEKLEKQKEQDITNIVPLDVNVGPCGEPKCKSRRKKRKNNRMVPHETVEEPQEKPIPSTITTKTAGKSIKTRRYLKSKPGPAGDIDKGPIKVSRRVMRYVYSIGDIYPGTNYGHKTCIDPRFRIPANMGWLWTTSKTVGKLKPRIGWKPGAIGRYLNELLKEAKGTSIMETQPKTQSTPSRTSLRHDKIYKSISYVSQVKKEGEEEMEPPPTLHIHRKDGTYYVTMYPIRQETTDVPHLEEPMKPLQFKIVRNKDDASVASSSTASDMEIEFSPPAAINKYRKKPDVIHVETQVRQQEILDAFKPTDEVPKAIKEKKIKREKREKK